jgi:hypothetical protein
MEILKQSHNHQTGIAQQDGKTVVFERADVSGNLDRVQRMRQADINNETLGRCVASIPLVAIAQWGAQFGIDLHTVMNDDKLLDRCIADYSKFKVHGGIY